MVTDEQVRRLMTLLKDGNPLIRAAVRAAMSEAGAQVCPLGVDAPAVRVAHTRRTRPDPYEGVWGEPELVHESHITQHQPFTSSPASFNDRGKGSQRRQFSFTHRLASGGGCICLKLRQRSAPYCQFVHRYADAMVR